MKNIWLLLFGVSIMVMVSCSEDRIAMDPDPTVQRTVDIELINEYMINNGFESSINDTTAIGVRYIILNDGGRSENGGVCGSNCIDESDIVTYRFTGMLLDGTIFDTSVQSVGDSLNQYYEENPYILDGDTVALFSDAREYPPYVDVYSSSGWAVDGFVTGFVDGFTKTLNKMNVGGSSRVLMPSDLAYGTEARGVLIPASSVLVFDFFPVKVEKQ